MNIDFAKLKDVKFLSNLDKIAAKEFSWWTPLTIREWKIQLAQAKQTIIATDNDEAVGFVRAIICKEQDRLWIEEVYVAKAYRKKRIAKKMVKLLTKQWKGRVGSIGLLTDKRNVKIFSKLGFENTMAYMEYSR